MGNGFLFLIVGMFIVVGLVGGVSAYTLPSDRTIDWHEVGIPGGIPSRTTICAVIDSTTYGSGTTDATSAIQSALNSCPANQAVYIPAGTYLVSSTIRIPSNVTLRGEGSNTVIHAQGSGSSLISFGNSATPSPSNSVSITGGSTKGSQTITLSDASGISVGSYLMVTQLNDPDLATIQSSEGSTSCTWCDLWGGTRVMGQIVEVTTVNGNTVGISPGLYMNYTLTPYATGFNAVAKYAGLENLKISMYNTGYTANIRMDGSAYCWVKGIESDYTDGDHLEALSAYRGEIRDSYFHDAYHHTPGTTDADVFIAEKSSGFLVENNVLRRLHSAIMLNWGASGNVIAYNYLDGCFDQGATNVLIMDMSMHGAHPMFNLYEGNSMATFAPDGIWGSSSHNTVFRNNMRGTTLICEPTGSVRSPETTDCHWAVQANRAISLGFASTHYNILGNAVGSPEMLALTIYNGGTPMGMQTTTICPQSTSYDAVAYSFSFGHVSGVEDNCMSGWGNSSYTTAILHGNYDYVSNSVLWNSGISDHNLPSSLFLTSKPAWFGNLQWPAIGPDVIGYVSMIPAQYCYEQGLMPGCLISSPAGSCASAADSDGDSVVSNGELAYYISEWKHGNVTIGDLIAAIGEWKNGC